jgi:hypothetical protein
LKIGIVGSFDSINKTMKVVKTSYPYIEPIVYGINRVNELHKIIEECMKLSNGIIFTGCAVSAEAERCTHLYVPYETILRDGSSIMKVFWDIQQDGKIIDNISIDTLEKELIEEIIDEFGLHVKNIYNKPFDPLISEAEYENWHISLYNEHKINLIITAFGSIYNKLLSLNLPVYRLNLTVPLIKSALDNLIHEIKNKEMEANQIGIQIFKIKNIKDSIKTDCQALAMMNNIVEKKLTIYAKKVQGSIFKLENNQFMIYSTRRTLENDQNLCFYRRIVGMLEKENIEICSGIGFGFTGWDAERNSKYALSVAEKESGCALYVIDQNMKIRGPINQNNETSYDLIITDERLNEISKKIGINPTYLSKLLAITKKSDNKYFCSETLANYLNISTRSARRLITKFEESGYGEIVTTAITKGAGRPKKIMKLKI